jgi:oxygen-independent coproporphyrinogen-3 oxidase
MNTLEHVQKVFGNFPADYFADKNAYKFRFYVLDDLVHSGPQGLRPYQAADEAEIVNLYKDIHDVALYVHSPWCRSRCTYCYYHQAKVEDEPGLRRLVKAEQRHALLLEEKIGLKAKNVPSIYFGGGTPTVLPEALLEDNLSFFAERYGGDGCEFCCEASPYTLTANKMDMMLQYVNRLSLGVQSFDADILKCIGRGPIDERIEGRIRTAIQRFPAVNIDLIYGLQHQTLENWLPSVQRAIDLGVTSITAYRLELREGTPIVQSYLKNPEQFPDEIACRDMYLRTKEMLLKAGYRENLVGWFLLPQVADTKVYRERWEKQTPCVAFGPDVHSYGADHFYDTLADRDAYIRAVNDGQLPIEGIGDVTPDKQLIWYALAQWKSNQPLSKAILRSKYGEVRLQWFMGLIRDYVNWQALIETRETIELTESARSILDWILGDVIREGLLNGSAQSDEIEMLEPELIPVPA